MPCENVKSLPEGINGENYSLWNQQNPLLESSYTNMLMMDAVIRNRPPVVKNSAKYLARNCLMCSNTGTYICNNLGCLYYKGFNVLNQISVSNAAKEDYSCPGCSFLLDKLHCSASKIVAYIEHQGLDNGTICILHHGNHSCLAKYRVHENTKNEIEEYFKNNPNALPPVAWYNILSKKIRSQGTEKEISQLVLLQVNDWVLSNIKSSLKSESIQSCSSVDIAQNVKQNFVDNPDCTKYNLIMDIVENSNICRNCNMVS